VDHLRIGVEKIIPRLNGGGREVTGPRPADAVDECDVMLRPCCRKHLVS
jgi:hypothetical protein